MIEVNDKPISPERLIAAVKTTGSGCVVTYVGLIRDNSQGKQVASVSYHDSRGDAERQLQAIADEAKQKWPVENVGIFHRTGKLKVGDINLVVAVAAAHRTEGFAACQYIIDEFKQRLPTKKTETYRN
jgi:molybdopterin synthase catalytic subunit